MGGAFTKKQRYMKGKCPKYWAEDMWPKMEELFGGTSTQQGVGPVSGLLCDGCQWVALWIWRNASTIWGAGAPNLLSVCAHEPKINEDGEWEDGLNFEEFAVVCWNYCTIAPPYMAKMVFEMFDVRGW